MEKIVSIIDPSFRTGMGKKGAWTLMKVQTESGKEASIFAPADVGDVVELEYNSQYKNYSAKKAVDNYSATDTKKSSLVMPDTLKIDKILKLVEQILANQTSTTENPVDNLQEIMPGAEEVPNEVPDDLEEVPFS